jgi:GNAT superfamily N-acetyltransferase
MTWRLTNREYEANKGDRNRAAFEALVKSGAEPGILAYEHETPIGWCAVAPRSSYPRLGRSRVLRPVDDLPVWSIVCLFVHKNYRRQGISTLLLRSAADFVADRGGAIVEGYPVEPKKDPMPDVFVFTGLASAFRAAGFDEVARRSETRPIMRLVIDGQVETN